MMDPNQVRQEDNGIQLPDYGVKWHPPVELEHLSEHPMSSPKKGETYASQT